jgi:electron transfer flavoprotein beta subunit
VCISSAADLNSPLEISAESQDLKRDRLILTLNPFDEYAIEEALKTKEKFGGTVEVIHAGSEKGTEILRKALAMGVDEAILLNTNEELTSLSAATLLAQEIQRKNYDIVFMGMQTVDYQNGIVGQMTAEICNFHIIPSCIAVKIEGATISGERETEDGIETIKTSLPAVITTNKGLNNPRYPSLKGVMAAKKKSIEIKSVDTVVIPGISQKLLMKSITKKIRLFDNDAAGIRTLVHVLKDEGRIS